MSTTTREVDEETRGGGGDDARCHCHYGGQRRQLWDLALPPAAGAMATDAAMKPSTGQESALMRDALLNNSNQIISLKGMLY